MDSVLCSAFLGFSLLPPNLSAMKTWNGKVGLQCANDAEMTTDEASPPHENFEEESLRTSDTDFETSIINLGNSLRKDEETHQAIIQLRDKVRELQDRRFKHICQLILFSSNSSSFIKLVILLRFFCSKPIWISM